MDKGCRGSARVCGLLLAAALLGACAQAGLPVATACGPSAAPVAGAPVLRVLIGFSRPVDGASEPVLRQLQAHSRACVLPLSSVSSSLHVYQFTGVEDVDRLRQRLQAWPLVQSVTPDGRMQPHQMP